MQERGHGDRDKENNSNARKAIRMRGRDMGTGMIQTIRARGQDAGTGGFKRFGCKDGDAGTGTRRAIRTRGREHRDGNTRMGGRNESNQEVRRVLEG